MTTPYYSGFSTLPLLKTSSLAAILVTMTTTVLAQDFPVTIDHKFGESVIENKPERVVSIDYGGIDNILALEFEPLAVRQWRPMDGYDLTAGPWAEPLLTTEPMVLDGDLDIEAIAELEPDVIIGVYSGIDEDTYDLLSLIAPVVVVPESVGDYALGWDERTLLTARALGETDAAQAQIDAITDRLEEIAQAHPEWSELTAVVGGLREGAPWAYTQYDVRGQLIEALGFALPEALEAMGTPDQFNVEGTPEDIAMIDADVTIWYGTGTFESMRDAPVLPFLKAHQNGGEIYLPDEVVAAFARLSLLSLPVAIEAMVPMLEAAADGDPSTQVPDGRPQ